MQRPYILPPCALQDRCKLFHRSAVQPKCPVNAIQIPCGNSRFESYRGRQRARLRLRLEVAVQLVALRKPRVLDIRFSGNARVRIHGGRPEWYCSRPALQDRLDTCIAFVLQTRNQRQINAWSGRPWDQEDQRGRRDVAPNDGEVYPRAQGAKGSMVRAMARTLEIGQLAWRRCPMS